MHIQGRSGRHLKRYETNRFCYNKITDAMHYTKTDQPKKRRDGPAEIRTQDLRHVKATS